MLNPDKFRDFFPISQKKIQLSSCSQSAMHQNVQEAINKYIESWRENGMDWESWIEKCENARRKFAKMINAEAEEIAIVSSVSHAISSVAVSIPKNKKKNKIVITESDFPTVGHVWLSQPDLSVTFLEPNDLHEIELEKYEDKITEDTLITSISHVSYYNGVKQDLKEIAKIAHKKGSYVFVDAYQSAGQTSIDVKKSNIDFLTTGLQKYMLGIPGVAFLYIKKEIAETMIPRITGWFGQKNPFAFDIKDASYAYKTKRFDTGTYPTLNMFVADAAMDVLLNIGVDEIEYYLRGLSDYSINYAQELGLTIKSPIDSYEKGSNTAIYTSNASEVERLMKEKGIIVSARNDVIRIAPHFYNDKSDIKKAMDILKETLI